MLRRLSDQARLQYDRVATLAAYRWGNWRQIPIVECAEPLVEVPPGYCRPYYADVMNLTADRRVFLRRGTLARFHDARKILMAEGYDLKIYDGWRSVDLQASLFWHYMREFTVNKFGLTERFAGLSIDEVRETFCQLPEETQVLLREANRTYVSWPSKDPTQPSPHATGGSVDVWLYQGEEPVSLGVPFDWMHEDAGAFYHFKWGRRRFPGNDRRICHHRERLILAMVRAGFSCYGPEIWHFNWGNQMDALVKGGPALYSYIEPT